MNEKLFKRITVDKASREPRYLQLAEQLRCWIIAAGLPEGSRLPSDSELVALTGLSLFTVRQSVNELVKAGLAERVHGKGTFIKSSAGFAANGAVALFIDEKQVERQYSSFYTVLYHHLDRALEEHGFNVKKFYLDAPEKIIDGAYRYRDSGFKKAVFLFPEIISDYRLLSRLIGVPAIFVDHYVPAERTASVVSPNRSGGRRAAEYLLSRGCTRLAFMGDELGRYNYQLRGEGFGEVATTAVFTNIKMLAEAVKKRRFDGVLCCADHLAVKLLEELAALGLKTPDDVKIISYDGTTILDGRMPSITALRVDLKDMAEQVCVAIAAPAVEGIYECRLELVEGDSTR